MAHHHPYCFDPAAQPASVRVRIRLQLGTVR